MRSPKKGKPKQGLESLRSLQTIHCLCCDGVKPAENSRKFRAWDVCEDCSKKVGNSPEKEGV